MPNLFFHHGPIRDQEYFFGRDQETTDLFDLLNHRQSISISGQRRLGKTSLIFHAMDPGIASKYGLDPVQTHWVYLDGGMVAGLQEDAVYAEIHRGLGGDKSGDLGYEQLLQRATAMVEKNVRVFVIFDEFEIFAGNPRFPPQLFNRLHSLASLPGNFPLQFVIVSKDPLAKVTFANADVLGSWFFSIFAPFSLQLFQQAEAVEMLTELSERGGSQFKPETVAFLLELVGPHPQFLQVAGKHAFQLQKNGALAAADRLILKDKVFSELKHHLDYYWRNLSSEEQYVLAGLPLMNVENPSSVVGALAESGLLVHNRYLGSMLGEFVSLQTVDGLLHHGPFLMDERRKLVAVDGEQINLTPTEYDALCLLLRNPGKLLSPEEIEAALWADEIAVDAVDPERAKGIVNRLRRSLGKSGEAIVTHRGQGWSLEGLPMR